MTRRESRLLRAPKFEFSFNSHFIDKKRNWNKFKFVFAASSALCCGGERKGSSVDGQKMNESNDFVGIG